MGTVVPSNFEIKLRKKNRFMPVHCKKNSWKEWLGSLLSEAKKLDLFITYTTNFRTF
jgi:nicotinamidase-related amidase